LSICAGWLVPGDALNKSVRTEFVEVRRLSHKGFDWLSLNGNDGFSLVLAQFLLPEQRLAHLGFEFVAGVAE
jgi:hypothetical protein